MTDSQKTKSQSNKYPFKTNEFIEEEVEVPTFTPVFDEKNNRVNFESTTKKVTQKTMYIDVEPKTLVCSDHQYIPHRPNKYLFKCEKCTWQMKVNPTLVKYDPKLKKFIVRETGEPLRA
jgi:chromatin remodeling complex protein RSC6